MSLKKFRYEYPPMEAHFIEAPTAESVLNYLKRTYPHNFDDVAATIVEIQRWPAFWKVVDHDGRVLPSTQVGS